MASKYQKFFNLMVEEHAELFERFGAVHEAYALNKKANQDRFNQVGKEVLRVVQGWDRKLCKTMESTNKSSFSTTVSDKFWGEVRKSYPLVDLVGVSVK
jgi:hypothetical protein